jgi:lipopolysaccharide transport system ATP-binding protein
MKPTEGNIRVQGKLSALIEVSAGFHPDLTGRENIYLNGTILGMKRHEIRARFDEIVAFSGLEDFLDTPVKRYSSGMYARLGFSVAAHLEPDILIIDEVLSVGDHVFQRKGVEKMASVLRGGATVIFVSHNMRAVADLCSRSILLDHGSILMEGPTNDVIKGYLNRVGASGPNTGQKAYVSGATTYGPSGPEMRFETGARIEVEIEFTAREDAEKFSVVLVIRDENHYDVFQTSTEVLGHPAISMKAGETRKIRFGLTLHLVSGTYHVEALLYRYDIQKAIDRRFPVTTFYVGAGSEMRGVANLYPKITMPD